MKNLIEPYKNEWKFEFESLKSIFNKEFEEYNISIEHVGSTAIPDLYSKPIIDIDIIIEDKTIFDKISEKLEKLGYETRGDQGISGRFAFRQTSLSAPYTKIARKWHKHHLYVCYADSIALKNHLIFRNALLKDKKLTEKYSLLKITLTNENGITKENYTKLKTAFILSVLSSEGLDPGELDFIKSENI
ncbi:MAG TPA: GrpB family protein [Saprospiraceae bacterium]|nr:GrpB family protein [Saprospiraceae bacterium]